MTKSDVKLIQVHGDTHARLTALKLPGFTYEDVINFALDKLPPEEVQSHYQAWQKEAWTTLSLKSKPLKKSRAGTKN